MFDFLCLNLLFILIFLSNLLSRSFCSFNFVHISQAYSVCPCNSNSLYSLVHSSVNFISMVVFIISCLSWVLSACLFSFSNLTTVLSLLNLCFQPLILLSSDLFSWFDCFSFLEDFHEHIGWYLYFSRNWTELKILVWCIKSLD